MSGIHKAIVEAMVDIQPIAKAKKNMEQKFYYRGIDDVMNELNPIMVRHKIFVYPEVINAQRQERTTKSGGSLLYSILTIKYHFTHEDGSELCVTVVGEGMDSGDKASNKAMAVAFKYACLQMFCIPTEDMDDPDGHTPPETRPINQAQTAPKPAQTAPTAAPPPEAAGLRKLLDEGKLGNLTMAAETALKNCDLNTIKGILKRYKELNSAQPEFENDIPVYK